MLHSPTHQEFLASKRSMVCLPKPTSTKNGVPYWDFKTMNETSSNKNTASGSSIRKKIPNGNLGKNSHTSTLRTRKQLNGKPDIKLRKVLKLQLTKVNGHGNMVNGVSVSPKSLRRKLNGSVLNGEYGGVTKNIVVNGIKTEKNHLVQKVHLTQNMSNGYRSDTVNGVDKNIQTRSFKNGTNKLIQVNGTSVPNHLKCRHCDLCFKTSWQMKEHMWLHTGIKAFPCSLCDLQYVKVSALIKHCTTTHGIDVTYKCQVCNQKMKHEEIYLNHLKTDHSEELETKELQKLKSCVDAYL